MSYFSGRQQYQRPQAMLWSNNPGTLANVPVATGVTGTVTSGSNVLILTGPYTVSVFTEIGQKILQTSGTGQFGTNPTYQSASDDTHIVLNVPSTITGTVTFTLLSSAFVPTGFEIGAATPAGTDIALIDQFMVISDHSRSPISIKPIRIEQKQRMINGRMRSYHVADKKSLSCSWENLPSRSFGTKPNFDITTGLTTNESFTVDGGAGGNELLHWYETHTGSFWVYLAYDKYTDFGNNQAAYNHITQYNEVIEMYISDFSYEIVKRGGSNFDMWNVSVTLEEA